MSIGSWIVTFAAIADYLVKARQAQEKLQEANDNMKRAAEALCATWQGDAAKAFADEQGVLYGYCNELNAIGAEYMSVLDAARKRYEEAEQAASIAIRG